MKVNYLRYLRSEAWQRKRAAVLQRDGFRCVVWSEHQATEVHHRTYAHLGDEPLEDLVSVCHACHRVLTALIRRERYAQRQVRARDIQRVIPMYMRLTTEVTLEIGEVARQTPTFVQREREVTLLFPPDVQRTTPHTERVAHGVQNIKGQNYRRHTPIDAQRRISRPDERHRQADEKDCREAR